jgi:AraC-like DNA-binding protein
MDDVDVVRAWRTAGHDRMVWMHGITTSYRVDPIGEYVIGVASGRSYHLTRGRSRELIRPGQLVVLDPTSPHSGSPAAQAAWASRILVVELPDLQAEMNDDDEEPFDIDFPEPRVGDDRLAQRFVALHQAMERPASMLERQSGLMAFLQDLAAASPPANRRTRRLTRDDPAVRRALEHLRGDVTRNVSLDELSTIAGTSRYQLVRRFRAAFGVPPHAYQVSQRVMLARRLLERGLGAAEVATRAGFVDQSHLHRHFRRRLGITPSQYARAFDRTWLQSPQPGSPTAHRGEPGGGPPNDVSSGTRRHATTCGRASWGAPGMLR